jgi:hypothetical protein
VKGVCKFPLIPTLRRRTEPNRSASKDEDATPKGPSVWERLRKPEL